MSDNYTFDEDNAVKFIRASLPEEIREKYTDDEILYVVDIVWDYYEKKGLLSLDNIDTEEELLDIDDLVKYVKKELSSDKESVMDLDDVKYLVKGELQYEESLEDPSL